MIFIYVIKDVQIKAETYSILVGDLASNLLVLSLIFSI